MRIRRREISALLPAQRALRAAAVLGLPVPGLWLRPLRLRRLPVRLHLHMRLLAVRLRAVRVRHHAVFAGGQSTGGAAEASIACPLPATPVICPL
jgi:hypothetical protein